MQRRINPVISRLQMLVEEAQPRISSMISDAAEMTHVARSQVQRVDRMVTEAVDRLRMQLVHADQILTGAMEAVEETGDAHPQHRLAAGAIGHARWCAAFKPAWSFIAGGGARQTAPANSRTKASSSRPF